MKVAARVFTRAFAFALIIPTFALNVRASAQSTSEGSAQVPCPTSVTFNYFDGTAWKPMTMVQDIPAKKHGVSVLNGLKHPLDPMAQYTNIRRYKGTAAPLTLGPSPRFCLRLSPSYNLANIVVASVDVKSDDREIESPVRADSWIPENHVRPIDAKRVSDTIVEITPSKPLLPGQYILNGPLGVYDFGVEAGK